MSLRGALALALVLSSTAAVSQSTSVSSNNQLGGVVAYRVDRVNIYQASQSDFTSRKLGAAVATYRDLMMQLTVKKLDLPYYTFLIDDPTMYLRNGGVRGIVLFAVQDDDNSVEARFGADCSAGKNIVVRGFESTSSGPPSGAVLTRAFDQDRAASLRTFCESLAKPISFIQSQPQAAGNKRTVFDYLRRNQKAVIIELRPARLGGKEFEELGGRYYWVDGFDARYNRIIPMRNPQENPDTFTSEDEDDEDDATEPYSVKTEVPIRYVTGIGIAAYPPQALREFGDRLPKFDGAWTTYLNRAHIMIRGRDVLMISGTSSEHRLLRFNWSSLGSRDFWLSAYDVSHFSELANCVAGTFLVDQELRAEEPEIDLGRCPRDS